LTQNPNTAEQSIAFAREVLEELTQDGVRLKHSHNYFSPKEKSKKTSDEKNHRVIYTQIGRARKVELKLAAPDNRAGVYPQHNNPGSFHKRLEIIDSLSLNEYSDILTSDSLLEKGFVNYSATMTKKRLIKIQDQFQNLTLEARHHMLALTEKDQRDIEVLFSKHSDKKSYTVARINPELDLVQFIQEVHKDINGRIYCIKHINFDLGEAFVVNESRIDKFGNRRNIAHVGVTGSKYNTLKNSLERFDDGTILWTVSDYSGPRIKTGSAAMKENGEVQLVGEDQSRFNQRLAEQAAKNMGAEGINLRTQQWTGRFSRDGCMPEYKDIFLMRREYKTAARKQVYQIVDGACIPGLDPIFDINF
jgi:hypothetical protein